MTVTTPWVTAATTVAVTLAVVAALLVTIAPGPVVLAAGTTFLALALMWAAVGASPWRPVSFPALWLYCYIALIIVPSTTLYMESTSPAADRFFAGILLSAVLVPAGGLLVAPAVGVFRRQSERFLTAPVETVPKLRLGPSPAYWACFAVCVLLTVVYIIELRSIPLLFIIRNPGAAAEAALLREESFKLLDSPLVYWYDVLRRVCFPFLICSSFVWLRRTNAAAWRRYFWLVTGTGVLFSSLSLAKIPIATIVLVLILTRFMLRDAIMTIRGAVVAVVAVLLLPLAILVAVTAGSSEFTVWFLIEAMFHRLFVVPVEIMLTYFELFPDHMPFLAGNTIGRVAWLKGEAVVDLANYVFRYMFPGWIGSGTAPAAFPGYFYADFGMTGVVFGALVVGATMQFVHARLVAIGKSPETVAAYAFMYWGFAEVNIAAFPMTFLSGGIVFAWLFAEIPAFLRRRATARIRI